MPRFRTVTFRKDRADFHVTESERTERAHGRSFRVKTGRESDAVGKTKSHHRDRIFRGDSGNVGGVTERRCPIEMPDREFSGGFGR